MSALKKRRTAIAVFVVVVIVFSLLGCHRSLSRRVREVEDTFFADQLTAPATQLNEAAKYANRILSAVNGAVDDTLYTAAVDQAAQAADGKTLDTTEDLTSLLTDFDGAMRVAFNSDYNLEVERFMETVANRFPTNILRHLAFVAMPEGFE